LNIELETLNFETMNTFTDRHIGIAPDDEKAMLATLGVNSLDELVQQTIPDDIRLPQEIEMDAPLDESAYLQQIKAIAQKNKPLRTLIGMGYYGTKMPAVILRNIFENPAWYTSYTPYQAEISQGRLEALLNFQTMVCSLTGMEVSNCSLLDEATAAAEAARMMFELRSRDAVKANKNVLFVDENIFPQTLAVIRTRCESVGIQVATGNYATYNIDTPCFGAIVQYPAANGEVRDYAPFARELHRNGALLTAVCDIMSLVLLREPAAFGADIAVGSTQRMGIPMGFGGPSAAYMACSKAYVRSMPGRIIGVSVDRLGNRALRMALQTREQHIKRERATSNICTAQALMATMAGMYAIYHGSEGLRNIALRIHDCAAAFANALLHKGYTFAATAFFDTVEIQNVDANAIKTKAEAAGFNFCYPTQTSVRVSFDEMSTKEETETITELFAQSSAKFVISPQNNEKAALQIPLNEDVLRTTPVLNQNVFQRYHSETEMMRYIKTLERRDISLTHSMISLGSCTMKLNAAVLMLPLSWSEFADVHPYIPENQAVGYYEMLADLSRDLAKITGFEAVTLQPNSGAAGEYAGLMIIRQYLYSRGEAHRNIVLIPASAHGTNPASAAMAGLQIVTIACDEQGNISLKDLQDKALQHSTNLACMMITYPSTHGVFESDIRAIVDIVHKNGGQVYMDGANMNAQVGYTHPAYMDADVCHLNLHKTFAMPHGGGGPGVGPVCVAKHLVPFIKTAVAASPFGSAYLLPITYGYLKMMGAAGLKKATATAILNANYLAKKLQPHFATLYTGSKGRVAHECIIDCRHFTATYGINAGDIARRLMDYGFHAPTLSFPVHETLMIEPTESESRSELDRFADALISIKQECENIAQGKWDKENNPLKMAPHTAPELCSDTWQHPYNRELAAFPLPYIKENKFFPYVTKIDNGFGDRNLVTQQV
jgi:glycine dehydrogenase